MVGPSHRDHPRELTKLLTIYFHVFCRLHRGSDYHLFDTKLIIHHSVSERLHRRFVFTKINILTRYENELINCCFDLSVKSMSNVSHISRTYYLSDNTGNTSVYIVHSLTHRKTSLFQQYSISMLKTRFAEYFKVTTSLSN